MTPGRCRHPIRDAVWWRDELVAIQSLDGGDAGLDPDSQGVDKPNPDTVEIDTSGITARKGTLSLIELGKMKTGTRPP